MSSSLFGGSSPKTVLVLLPLLAGPAACTLSDVETDDMATGAIDAEPIAYSQRDRDCLERAIFFESNRSGDDGLVAVGTVVMNRVASPEFPDTVCGVVGQPNQFAPGVMSRHLPRAKIPDVTEAATSVLEGERSSALNGAMFFHTDGLSFPYDNMDYQHVAGGNAFYIKR